MVRVALALILLAWVPLVVAFSSPGPADVWYSLFVVAHGLNLGGFVVGAVGDALAKRRFAADRLALVVIAEIVFAILGPVVMSARRPGPTELDSLLLRAREGAPRRGRGRPWNLGAGIEPLSLYRRGVRVGMM